MNDSGLPSPTENLKRDKPDVVKKEVGRCRKKPGDNLL